MVNWVGTLVGIVFWFAAANAEASLFSLCSKGRFDPFLFNLGRSGRSGSACSRSKSGGVSSSGRGSHGGGSRRDASSMSVSGFGNGGGSGLSFGFSDFLVDAIIVRSMSTPSSEISWGGCFVHDATEDMVLESFLVKLDSCLFVESCKG